MPNMCKCMFQTDQYSLINNKLCWVSSELLTARLMLVIHGLCQFHSVPAHYIVNENTNNCLFKCNEVFGSVSIDTYINNQRKTESSTQHHAKIINKTAHFIGNIDSTSETAVTTDQCTNNHSCQFVSIILSASPRSRTHAYCRPY